MYAMQHTPHWIMHFSQNVIMDSDVVFLASQDEKLSYKPGAKLLHACKV
jgi:hypothetical protein